MAHPILFIVGPTAVGKSEQALLLAERLGGEIVSSDAMQVYRDINIASNKPSLEERARVPHHVIDVVPVEEAFDVVQFCAMARPLIEDICSRGRLPIVVGGSGLYTRVLLDGMDDRPSQNPALRAELLAVAHEQGAKGLHDQLALKDPQAAARIHPNDVKRVIRALEVFEHRPSSGKKISKKHEGMWGKYDITMIGLDRKRDELYDRINRRVDEMFEGGLVDEVKALQGRSLSVTARQIIGVREAQAFLDGAIDEEQAKYLVKLHTRHYAKRQLTWFRRDERVAWFVLGQEGPGDTHARLLKHVKVS